MPDVKYLNSASLLGDVVKDPVGSENDLAQRAMRTSRIGRPNQWKRGQNANVSENSSPHPKSSLGIVPGNVRAKAMQIRDGRVGPNYLEVHAVAQDSASRSTSCWLLLRPAAMSARPRRTAAMMVNSAVISASEAASGNRLSASITACLSVMRSGYRRDDLEASVSEERRL